MLMNRVLGYIIVIRNPAKYEVLLYCNCNKEPPQIVWVII